jgi:hypothetical protein
MSMLTVWSGGTRKTRERAVDARADTAHVILGLEPNPLARRTSGAQCDLLDGRLT